LAVEAVSEVDRFGQDKPLHSILERYNSRERDFTKLDLNATVLDVRGIHPRRAKFVRANVKTCDFRDADLRHANLQDTALEGPPFAGTKLDGATFFGAGMYSHRFTEDNQIGLCIPRVPDSVSPTVFSCNKNSVRGAVFSSSDDPFAFFFLI
jgi:hypothetical protein